MVNNVPMQGDIIKINLDPKMGHEQMGYRPYLPESPFSERLR
jgi:mRNA-degrading endonuclease toxin of MazEF toxin-antitoxin module